MNNVEVENVAMNLPSLCIPRVFKNITETRIRKVLGELNLGEISRVDIVSKSAENGDTFNRVFIHFKHWNTYGTAKPAREKLLQGKDIKIIYDEPWFWKVSAYRNARGENKPAPTPKKKYVKPSIQFDDDVKPATKPTTTVKEFIPLRLEIPPSPLSEPRTPDGTPPAAPRALQQNQADNIYGDFKVKKRAPLKAQKVQTIKVEAVEAV